MEKLSLSARLKAEVVSFSGKMAVYGDDFRGNKIVINENEEFEAASCIKVFILTEFFRQVKMGIINPEAPLTYEPKHYIIGSGLLRSLESGITMKAKHFAKMMIIISDNVAANMMIDKLGIDNINKTCQDLGFTSTKLHNPINFEQYERLGTTTPRDYGHFYEKLYKEELWSPEISRQMLAIFKDQHYNTMLTADFPQYYLDSEDTGDEELIYVASKSGSMDACRNDGGLVYTPYGSYSLIIFTKKFKDPLYYKEHEAIRYGSKASRLVLDQYLALKGKFE